MLKVQAAKPSRTSSSRNLNIRGFVNLDPNGGLRHLNPRTPSPETLTPENLEHCILRLGCRVAKLREDKICSRLVEDPFENPEPTCQIRGTRSYVKSKPRMGPIVPTQNFPKKHPKGPILVRALRFWSLEFGTAGFLRSRLQRRRKRFAAPCAPTEGLRLWSLGFRVCLGLRIHVGPIQGLGLGARVVAGFSFTVYLWVGFRVSVGFVSGSGFT